MIVDRLEVFGFHGPLRDARLAHQAQRDVAYQVLDELGVCHTHARSPIFVRPLEQSEHLAGRLSSAMRRFISVISPEAGGDGDVGALVVSPYSEIFFEQGLQARHRRDGFETEGGILPSVSTTIRAS